MRLLLATEVAGRGGVDRYVGDLFGALSASGHEVHLALDRDTTSGLRATPLPPGRLHYLPLQRGHAYRLRHQAAQDLLARLQPDGMHVVGGSPRACLVLREEAVETSVPLVITEQQVPDQLTLDPAQTESIRTTYRAARSVIFVCQGNRATMADLLGLDGVRTTVIPNAVDVTGIAGMVEGLRRPVRKRRTHVMTVARYALEKRLEDLIAATAHLEPTEVERVDAFGDGPNRATLEQLIREQGLTTRFRLLGWRNIIPELARHDLFVLSSEAEGLPYALLEAMAASLPVVTTDSPGCVEAIGAGEAGTVVPRCNVPALAEAIRTALSNPEESWAKAQRARERVAALYDLPAQMARTVALWN